MCNTSCFSPATMVARIRLNERVSVKSKLWSNAASTFLQALRNCKVFYSKLSFCSNFWLETNFTSFFFFLTGVRNLIANPERKWIFGRRIDRLGDNNIKKICQICDVKVWTERETGISVVFFSLQWRKLVFHKLGVMLTSWTTVSLPVPEGLCSVKLVILVYSAPKSWLVLTNQTIKFLVCVVWVCACVRFQKQQDTCSEMGDRRSDYVSCAAPQSLPTAVRAEKGSETLVHERCKWAGTVWGAERPMFRHFRILFSFTKKTSVGKTTRRPFSCSTNEISATEISRHQLGIALFRNFDQSVKKWSSFENSQRFQSVQKRCSFGSSKHVPNVQKRCYFGSSKHVQNVQKKCSYRSSKHVPNVQKKCSYGSSKLVPNVQKKCSFGGNKRVQNVQKRCNFGSGKLVPNVQKKCCFGSSKRVQNVQKKCSYGSSKHVPNVQKRCYFGSSKRVQNVQKKCSYESSKLVPNVQMKCSFGSNKRVQNVQKRCNFGSSKHVPYVQKKCSFGSS